MNMYETRQAEEIKELKSQVEWLKGKVKSAKETGAACVGAYLIDNYEIYFDGGEEQIANICRDALEVSYSND